MTSRRIARLIFPLIIAALALTSCADNYAVRLRYAAEKELFDIEKDVNKTSIKPELNDPAFFKEIRTRYGSLLDYCYSALDSIDPQKYPEETSNLYQLTYSAATRLSQFYYAAEQFDTCAVIIDRLMREIRINESGQMNNYYNLGRALQASGKWDSALVVYTAAIEKFNPPIDADGEIMFRLFNIPMNIYEVAQTSRDVEQNASAFTQAEYYYQDIISRYPGEKIAFASYANLAKLYNDSKMWREAVYSLSHLTDTAGFVFVNAQMQIADIYAMQLKVFDTALMKYDEIDAKLTGNDTLYRPTIFYKRAVVALNQKRFADARAMLVQLEHRYPGYFAGNPSAQQAKARTFELEDNWERAEGEYRFLIEKYPDAPEAMSTLLFLAQHYADKGLNLESDKWYNRAEKHFDEIAAIHSGTAKEATALVFKAELFRQKRNWLQAAETFKRIFTSFPRTEPGRQAIVTAAQIYRDKLNDPVTAEALMEELKRSLMTVDENSDI
ncbi:MAG: hypothetical protein SGI97_07725 [candidate division Zixibacteria bacterium]|nr:hypothetical protein [candidate division Zixibacteria bacterium]